MLRLLDLMCCSCAPLHTLFVAVLVVHSNVFFFFFFLCVCRIALFFATKIFLNNAFHRCDFSLCGAARFR
jgi:hypothetical protein